MAVAICLFSLPALAQKARRVVINPLIDRTDSGAKMNISKKAADAISSLLTQSGKYVVVERENLGQVQSEKNLKDDAEFSAAGAPRSGLQKVADLLITGQIDEFSALQNSASKGGVFKSSTQVTGSANLAITIKIISLETGEVIGSANAKATKTGVLSSSSSTPATGILARTTSLKIPETSNKNTTDGSQELIKLVDEDIQDVAGQIVEQMTKGAAAATPALPKVLGLSDGLAIINKGSNNGIEQGKVYDVVRPTDTGITDPENNNQPVIVRKKICTLTIVSVDDTTSQGKCVGAAPAKGDELKVVTR
jgi:curli biogenesis system outer membrane secretion channel CsgG